MAVLTSSQQADAVGMSKQEYLNDQSISNLNNMYNSPFSSISGGGGWNGGGQERSTANATAQYTALNDSAEALAGPAKYEQLAGEGMSDVDSQFAGQRKASQVRSSRMGIDPSQNASQTSDRQSQIMQAVTRAGVMQSARRSAEATQEASKQNIYQQLNSSVNQDKEFAQQMQLSQAQSDQSNSSAIFQARLANTIKNSNVQTIRRG